MVPTAFVELDTFPATPNGKVDRKALPAPDGSRPQAESEYVAPRSPIEETVADIWANVLGVERVGIRDNFFELGGDSLLSIRIISRAAKAGLTMTPVQFFNNPTIAGVMAAVTGDEASDAELESELVSLGADDAEELLKEVEDSQERGGESLIGFDIGGGAVSNLADRIAALSPEQRRLLHQRLREQRSSGGEPSSSTSIPRRGEGDAAAVSYAQERFWFLSKFVPESSAYHIPLRIGLRGALNLDALTAALSRVWARHESLRTVFVEKDGEIRPHVLSSDLAQIPVIDLSMVAEEEKRKQAEEYARDMVRRPFDLEEASARFGLVRLSADEHWLVSVFHHIVFDGWSSMVFLRELQMFYEDGSSARLPELAVQFGDFAVWERKCLQSGILESQLSYWRNKLGGNLPVLELPVDHPRPANLSYEGSCLPLALSADVLASLKQLAKSRDATLFMVLATAFKVLLYRYTMITDICVGTPVARRNRPEIENAIGCFINTLPLRTDLSEDPSLLDLLARVKQTCIEAFARQDVPFQRLVEELSPVRDLSHTPIFQIMLILHVQDTLKISRLGDVELSMLEYRSTTSKVDLTLELKETDDGLEGWFEYSTDLFDESTVGRMAAQFERLLGSIVSDPARRISELDILPSDERRRLLVDWNATESDHPRESTVQELFAAQSARTPKSTAVVCRGESLSYAELDARSNQLARHLDSLGVGVETPVGLYLERSLEMAVGLLGVLKAGGAYIPLDPAFPNERLAFMVRDAGALLLPKWRARRLLRPESAGSPRDPRQREPRDHRRTVVRLKRSGSWE